MELIHAKKLHNLYMVKVTTLRSKGKYVILQNIIVYIGKKGDK